MNYCQWIELAQIIVGCILSWPSQETNMQRLDSLEPAPEPIPFPYHGLKNTGWLGQVNSATKLPEIRVTEWVKRVWPSNQSDQSSFQVFKPCIHSLEVSGLSLHAYINCATKFWKIRRFSHLIHVWVLASISFKIKSQYSFFTKCSQTANWRLRIGFHKFRWKIKKIKKPSVYHLFIVFSLPWSVTV